MPSLAALTLATVLLSDLERGSDHLPRASIELDLELPALEPRLALTVLAERVYAREGWFGIAIDDELAVLIDVRMDGPASQRAFSASFGVALAP